jgi:hypothetical protein
MAGDEVELPDRPAEDLGGLESHVAMRCTVEAVAPDAQLPVEGVGQPIDIGFGGDGMVEGRVEDADLGDSGQERLAGLDALEVMGVMEGRELDALADRGLDLVRDQDGLGEVLAPVDDAVPDAVDLALLADDAVLGAEEEVQDHFDGHAVIEDLADLPDPGPAFRLVGDDGVA